VLGFAGGDFLACWYAEAIGYERSLQHPQQTFRIIIVTDNISIMQGIYAYIRETNHVPKEYSVAAVLSLLFMAPISLAPALALTYVYISAVCAVPNMEVFCSSLT
jgi:hypothetical protein